MRGQGRIRGAETFGPTQQRMRQGQTEGQAAMTEQLTILTGGGAATKIVTRREDGSYHFTPYSAGKWFRWRETPVAGIAGLARVIEGLGSHDFPIRGSIHDDVRDQDKLRRQLVNFGGRDGATPCQWAMLDLDKVSENPALDLYEEPEDVAEWLISEYLPPPFHDVSCYWQFSSSAGVTPGLSAHLFFWLDRRICGGDLKHYLEAHAPSVDLAPIRNDVQPHYIAPPVFSDCHDPLPRRAGLMEREHDFATLPQIDRVALTKYAIEHSGAPIPTRGFRENLKLIGAGDGHGQSKIHVPIRTAIMWAVRDARGPLDDRQIKAEVRDAIHYAPKDGRDLSLYLSDKYLDDSIIGAVRKRQSELIRRDRPGGVERVTLETGEARLKAVVADFMSAVRAGDTPVHAIAAEAGLGKTEAVLAQISRLLRNAPSLRVHYYIDTHRLGEEIAGRYAKFVATSEAPARIHRGRDRDELSPDGLPMCFDDMRDKARAFDEANVSVSQHLCPHCPHLGKCSWSRQKQDKGPGLVIKPANYAFEDSAKQGDIQIFDESFWQTGIMTQKANLGELLQPLPTLPTYRQSKGLQAALDDRLDLGRARAALRSALHAADNSIPTLAQLRDAGIDAEMARRAKGLEYRRADSIKDKVTHTMSAAEIRHASSRFEHAGAAQWGALWRSIEEQIELDRERIYGWRQWTETKDDATVPWMLLRRSKELRGGAIPTLFLDATADDTILRRFAPELSKVTRIAVQLGAVRVTQITDTPMGKNKIAPADPEKANDHQRPEEEKRKRNNAHKLARLTEVVAAGRERIGLVTYKATEEEIGDMLPANVTTGHFNATRGQNLWEDTDAFIIAGRPQPSEDETEWLAEALFWKDPVEIKQGRFGDTASSYVSREGEVDTEAVAHPDPIVEGVRWQICEGELIQNFARPRPIRRGADRPVEILILTNVPLALPVDHLTTWDELVPDRLEVVGARGVVLDNNADLARAYPDLFKDTEAAKNARRRRAARTVSFPYNKVSIGKRHGPPTEVHYQLAGKGQKLKRAYYCPDQVADIRAWLTNKLGAVTAFEVVGFEPTPLPDTADMAENIDIQVGRAPPPPADVDPPFDAWTGGHLTADQAQWAHDRLKTTAQTQEDVARAAGLSRPQLTNALRGRFGLSEDAARRVHEVLDALPVVQPGLGFL